MIVIWILVIVYAAMEWPQVRLLVTGFFVFCLGLLALMVLAVGFCGYWLLDEGLKRFQDFVCSQAETLE